MNLTPSQRKAVTSRSRTVLVEGDIGTGKTTVLAHRVANRIRKGSADTSETLVMTGSSCGARFLKRMIRQHRSEERSIPPVMSIPQWCAHVLRETDPRDRFTLYDASDERSLVARCLKHHGYTSEAVSVRSVWGDVRRARTMEAVGSLTDEKDRFDDAALASDSEILAAIYPAYRKRLDCNCVLDHCGLLDATLRVLRDADHEEFARPTHLFVDDAHNLDPLEVEVIAHLARKPRRATDSTGRADMQVTVAGNPTHTVRRPVPESKEPLDRLRTAMPDAHRVQLGDCFRPPPDIRQLADRIGRTSTGPRAASDEASGKVLGLEAASGKAEIRKLASWIEENVDAERRSDVAILVRTGGAVEEVVDGLRNAGVSAQSFVPLREEESVRDVIAYLMVALNPHDDHRLLRVINRPSRGIGRKTKAQLRSAAWQENVSLWSVLGSPGDCESLSSRTRRKARRLRELLEPFVRAAASNPRGGKPSEWARTMIREVGLLTSTTRSQTIEQLRRKESIETLLRALDDARSGDGGLRERLADLLDRAVIDRIGPSPAQDAVRVGTIDERRGCSTPVVIVAGLEEGRLPHADAVHRDALLRRERHLFIEAVTRTEVTLVLSWARSRRRRGEDEPTTRSRFLDSAGGALTAAETGVSAGDDQPDYRESLRARQSDSRPDPKPTEEEVNQIRSGHRVRHPKMGVGTVVEMKGEGEERTAVVDFDERGRKNLRLRYVSLSVIGSAE